jgi:two-component system, OmpR family, response regulator
MLGYVIMRTDQVPRVTRLLLIDENHQSATKIVSVLDELGYHLSWVKNYAVGVRSMAAAPPDLIIVHEEPGKIEVPYHQIKLAYDIPIIVLGDCETKVEILDFGADACMVDPLNSRELVARIKALLRRR